MDYKIVVTQAAHRDLDEAVEYISSTLKNPDAAARLLDRTEACYEQLRQFPFLFEACREPRLREIGYRRAVIDSYILIYHPVKREHTVYIMRFFYGGREYEKLI